MKSHILMPLLNTPFQPGHCLEAVQLIDDPQDRAVALGEYYYFTGHHGLLGGALEATLKKDWPKEFKRIINITYNFSSGWRKIHNPVTGEDVADNLTTTEFAIAMLAAHGWSNQEIAEHMELKTSTVKWYVSIILDKLNVEKRDDLLQYMLSR